MKKIISMLVMVLLFISMFSFVSFAADNIILSSATYNSTNGIVTITGTAVCEQVVLQIWTPDNQMLSFVSVAGNGDFSTDVNTGFLQNGLYTVKAANYDGGSYVTKQFTVSSSSPGGNTGGSSVPVTNPSSNSTVQEGSIDNGDASTTSLTVNFDNNSGIASVQTDSASIENALSNTKADDQGIKTVDIKIPSVSGAASYSATIPSSAVSSNNSNNRIEIQTEYAVVTLPGNMLTADTASDLQNVTLNITQANKSSITNSEVISQIGDRPIIELNLKQNGQASSWSNEAAPVKISIPYTPKPGEDNEHIVVWYIDGAGKAIPVTSGKYDAVTGTVIFSVTHFSTYAVSYVDKTFSDISNYTWAKKQIEVLTSKGVIEGTEDQKYNPGASITRADFLSMLIKTLDLKAKVTSNFSDIKSEDYYYDQVGTAKALGIALGSNGEFNPKSYITRQDMMALTVRALKAANKKLDSSNSSDMDIYSDKTKISSYAIDSVATLVKAKLITGSNGKINPLGNTSRAEAAVLLYRIYNFK
jgi:lactocepin